MVHFVVEFLFHEHGLPEPHFCRTLGASWDKLALGGESFKLNNLTDPRSISSSAQKRIQLGLGWPNTMLRSKWVLKERGNISLRR